MPIATNPQTGEVVYLNDSGQWEKAQTAVNPETKKTMAYDGNGWVDYTAPSKSRSPLQYVDDVVRSIANGVTFGWADELAAKGNELIGSGSYGDNLKAEKARSGEISPYIKYPGEIGGAVAGAVAAAPVTGAASIISGASKLPAVLRGAGVGATTGALYGAGEADPGERTAGAVKGGLIGAPIGAATPYVIRGGQTLVNEIFSPQKNVAADLGRAIMRDETTPQALLQQVDDLSRSRPGVATLADVGGENVRGLVERVAQTPGAGRTQIVPALTSRQRGQMSRLTTDLRSLTGTQTSAFKAIQETMEERANTAKPLYDAAMNFNAREVPEIVQAWQRVTSTGWGKHVLSSPDLKKTLQTEYGIDDIANAPLMVLADAWKKGADDLISDAIKSGGNNKARVLQGMRDDLVGVLDKHNQAYAKARDAWAGPSRYLQAIEEGRNILSTKVSADELAAALKAMPASEREGFKIGAISSIVGKMGNDPAKMADLTKYLRSPENQAKIAALMPDDAARAEFQKRLQFEIGSSELTSRALGNSATARRLAEQKDAENLMGDLILGAIGQTPPMGLIQRMVGGVSAKVRDTFRSRSDAVLADLLTNPNAMPGMQKALSRVTKTSGVPPVYGAAIAGENALLLHDR